MKVKKISIYTLLIVILSSITVYAVNNYSARDISFTSSHSSWNPTNLEDAINDLYSGKRDTGVSYVTDSLVYNVSYKNDLSLVYEFGPALTEDGYQFTGSNGIKLKRYQNSNLTYEIYFKSTNITKSQYLVSSREYGGCALRILSSKLSATCNMAGTYYEISDNDVLEQDKWYHAVLTAGDNGMKLYLNGVEKVSDEHGGGVKENNGTITGIGAEPVNTSFESGCYFYGNIKLARVYGKVLSPLEIQKNYNDAINNY